MKNYMYSNISRPVKQRGVTLLMALIFLAVLALLGVTAARNSVLEERMAGNTRDRDLAFQAAEEALKKAENELNTNLATVTASNGYTDMSNCTVPTNDDCYLSQVNSSDYWNGKEMADGQWSEGISNLGADTDEGGNSRYIVWKLPDGAGGLQRYRVTARGVGKSTDTVVILQAEFSQ
jgi:type IV pilus assembly protein PilX